jgi:segregation and condensation protein B
MTIADWDVRAIIEGLLFVADRPLTAEEIAEVLLKQYLEAQEDAADAIAEAAPLAANEEVAAPSELTASEALTEDQVLAAEGGEAVANEDVAPTAEPLSETTLRRELVALSAEALRGLEESYQDEARQVGRGFELVHVAGAYQLRTRATAGVFIRQFLQAKPTRLSRAQLEVLAIIAYRQPVTKPGIEQIRGVDCSNSVRVLLERKLVRILGKAEEVGRPLLYGTSKEFLEFFRLNSLLELPTLREFQELSEEHRKRVEDELDREAPLGSLQDLADSAPKLAVDDSDMLGTLDQALASAKSTVQRVADITGLKSTEAESDEPAR